MPDNAYNPEDTKDYRLMSGAILSSCTKKRKFEEHRMKLMKRWVGPDFGGYGVPSRQRRPINMFEVGIDILSRFIASAEIEALIQTEFRDLAPTAYDFQIVLNRKLGIRDLGLAESLSICAIESLFTLGVMCVGLNVETDLDPGKVFAEPVLFPDLVVDMSAKSWSTQKYVGHDFLIAFDDLKNSGMFEGRTRDLLIRRRDQQFRNNRDWDNGMGTGGEEFRDMLVLRQLYIPHLNRVIICEPGSEERLPLASNEWKGPAGANGPYTPLYYRAVPGHVLPLAIVPFWYDLDDLINKCFGKGGNQALRGKVVGVTRSPADAETIKKAADGEIVNVEDPAAVQEQRFGGTDQSLYAMVNFAKQLLTYVGGNWDLVGGLSAASPTASQDQILSQGANGRIQDMQQKMINFESKVIQDIGYWVWTDPVTTERFSKRIEGTRFSVDDGVWSPENRPGDFFQYNFTVNPHKRVKRSPDEQANGLLGMVTNVILPALPYMQNGSPIDWEQLFDLIARYSNYPELRSIIRWPQGDSLPEPQPDMPAKPTTSHRTYERVSNSSRGSAGMQQMLLAQMFSQGNSQAADASQSTPMMV